MIVFLIVLVFVFTLYVLSTKCLKGHPELERFQNWSYAHRGLYGPDAPENSLEAFRRARDAGYGVELDVHLLADGNLAVIHDSQLSRITGKQGCVEDLAAHELFDYKLCGTDYAIPLFCEVLEVFSGKVPLIVELKVHNNNHAQLCQKVCQQLDDYKGLYCLESFDPRCVLWLKKNRPDLIRGQLTENYFRSTTSKIPWVLKFVLTNQMLNFLVAPHFIAPRYPHRKNFSSILSRRLWGASGVTWTVQNQEEYDLAVSEGWIPIFEGFCP